MTKYLYPIKNLLDSAERFNGEEDFFNSFSPAMDSVRSQILKLETRQTYIENSESLKLYLKGDLKNSIELLKEERKKEKSDYDYFLKNKIEFIRCRPISIPRTKYIEWEMESYKISSQYGEKIFFCHYRQIEEILKKYATHDFMIFDARFAFIHDYNSDGRLVGGWRVTNTDSIIQLLSLFAFIKANCFDCRL